MLCFIITLSEICNLGISENPFYRRWDLSDREYGGLPNIRFQAVDREFHRLKILEPCQLCNATEDEKISEVARVEWEIGVGPLHPFGDGCGRASRAFSVLLALLYQCSGVIHRSRLDYFKYGSEGIKKFQEYFLALDRVNIIR